MIPSRTSRTDSRGGEILSASWKKKMKTKSFSSLLPILITRCISGFVSYLWGGDVKDFSDLSVQFPDISESVDPACWTPVGQLSVEDEPRSQVIRRPCRRRRRRRERRRRGFGAALTLPLGLGLLVIHDLRSCCLGVQWAHSLPVLHQAPARVSREPQMCTAAATKRNSVLGQPGGHPELWGKDNKWISDESNPVTVAGRGQPDTGW